MLASVFSIRDYKILAYVHVPAHCAPISYSKLPCLRSQNCQLHAVWVYKKHPYKKRLFKFPKNKKQQLVNI